ncbi:MerR family DNA-binding protein [Terriglobus sp.]|uniref:MerR family DNA-binding protein n=1 Tax=Terriglobus sp. TaxID=1889013 RepID=UPI003B0028F4
MPLRTSELARNGGVNPQTLRYYEREGLLPEPPRLDSGYRLYPENAVSRIRFIKRSQELGFTLDEIRDLLALRVDRQRDRGEVRRIAKSRLAEIDARIQSLQTMRTALEHVARNCHGHGPADECPILLAIDSAGEL